MSLPPLEIRTKDNNTASFDLTVTYKIMDDSGYLIVQRGEHEGNRYRQRVISAVEGILREELANMESEEIYSTQIRLERAEAILPILRTQLEQYFVEPESVLIRAETIAQFNECAEVNTHTCVCAVPTLVITGTKTSQSILPAEPSG